VRSTVDHDKLTAGDALMSQPATGVDGQDPVLAPVHNEHRDVDLGEIGPEVRVPRGDAGNCSSRRSTDGSVPGILYCFFADPLSKVLIEVVEVLVPLGEISQTIAPQGGPYLVEHLLGHPIRRLRRLEERADRPVPALSESGRSALGAPWCRAVDPYLGADGHWRRRIGLDPARGSPMNPSAL
jgi:hypothetical protein